MLCCTSVAAGAQTPTLTLDSGQHAFWTGPFVAGAQVQDPSLCDITGPCFDYPIRVVPAHADALRVAIDSTDESNGWEVRLLDPSGAEVASDTTYQLGGLGERLDAEVFAHHPAPGLWTMQVIPQNVQDGDFRARAALMGAPLSPVIGPAAVTRQPAAHTRPASCHAAPPRRHRRRRSHKRSARHAAHAAKTHRTCRAAPKHAARAHAHARATAAQASANASQPGGVTDLPPDIAPDPPWHLTFAQPLPQVATEAGNVTALVGLHNPVAQLAGQPIYQCLPEETIEQGAHRCLRFSSGVASIGRGEFEVYGSADVPVAVNGGPLYQVVYRSDGSSYSRPAGSFIFHKIHLHYHVLALAEFPLFRVEPDHTMVPTGQGLKEGFCLGNLKIYDWSSFGQDEINPNSIDNCEPSPHPNAETNLPDGTWRFYEGVASGWEDVYTWATSGQFVDFNTNPDGYYVMQMIVNPKQAFLETNYDNDIAYTYFQVSGNDVRVIERGRGASPWDPHKVVLDPVITR